MIQTAITQLETTIVSMINTQAGHRRSSQEIATILQGIIAARTQSGEVSRILVVLTRLVIKAAPYVSNIDALVESQSVMLRAWATVVMPQVLATVDQCVALQLPVPVIFSCEKYLEKARQAQAGLKGRYFGIEPIIVRGDATASEESAHGSIVTLPCDDSYEGLPAKIFNALTFFHELGATHGVLKIDDDLELHPMPSLQALELSNVFASLAYAGCALRHLNHDRSWHFGKCLTPVPAVYGKPFTNAWARGALYYVSGPSLALLSRHYLRFPGCIDGELYEDKAVGDVLYQLGVGVTHFPLESILGIRTDAPERAIVAAE